MCLGIPGQVIEICNSDQQLGMVDVGGVKRAVNLACIIDEKHPLESCIGDWVLVHVGFAMSRIDEEEAAKTLQVLEQLGEVQRELDVISASAKPDE